MVEDKIAFLKFSRKEMCAKMNILPETDTCIGHIIISEINNMTGDKKHIRLESWLLPMGYAYKTFLRSNTVLSRVVLKTVQFDWFNFKIEPIKLHNLEVQLS